MQSAPGARTATSIAPQAASAPGDVQILDETVEGGGQRVKAGGGGSGGVRPAEDRASSSSSSEEEEEDWSNSYGHAGMVEAAERVTALLHTSGLLRALLASEGLNNTRNIPTPTHTHTHTHTDTHTPLADEAPAPGRGRHVSLSVASPFHPPHTLSSWRSDGRQGERSKERGPSGRERVYNMLEMGEKQVYVAEDILGTDAGGGRCQGFDLVLVGHSLGAGVATLVSMLLKV